jgi:hypothetical protein
MLEQVWEQCLDFLIERNKDKISYNYELGRHLYNLYMKSNLQFKDIQDEYHLIRSYAEHIVKCKYLFNNYNELDNFVINHIKTKNII